MSNLPSVDEVRAAVEALFDESAEVSLVYQMMSTVFRCRLESGTECYLKTAPVDEIASQGWVLRDRRALQILAPYDVAVPRLLFSHEDLPDWRWAPFMITSLVPGAALKDMEPSSDRREAFRGMGRWLADLQAVDPVDLVTPYGEGGRIVVAPELVPFSERVVEVTEAGQLNDLYRPTQYLIDTLELGDELGWLPALHRSLLTEDRYGIVHGDYTPRHFFYDEGRVMGLDLMTLSVGFPFRDLGKTRAHSIWNDLDHDTECYEWVVDGYTDGRGLSDEERLAAEVGFVVEALELAALGPPDSERTRNLVTELLADPILVELRGA